MAKPLSKMREKYAQLRAQGVEPPQAYVAAGFSPASRHSNATILENNMHVAARIKELRGGDEASPKVQVQEMLAGKRPVPDGAQVRRRQQAELAKNPPTGADDDQFEAETSEDRPLLREDYASGLELLQDLYNNPRAPMGVRMEAAKQALPYESSKKAPEAKGKKEQQLERAKAASGRFAPTAPPSTKH